MTQQQQTLDLLDKILSKNLQSINNADTKATLLFAVDSGMLGVLTALIPIANKWTIGAAIFAAICGLILIASICFLLIAAFPRLDGPGNSVIYFGGIAFTTNFNMCRK